jgi:hypothetical protein
MSEELVEGTVEAVETKAKSEKTISFNWDKSKKNCGDEVALKLEGKKIDEVYAIGAEALGCEEAELRTRYAGKNNGLVRLTIGNRMRRALKVA